ncbi:hypothetical protein F4604DRAFT_1165548 [Suillus subluteus]|nr:hypothetical protein F4604DRAFT_1165548 [Suillus subluteus]
MTGFSAESSSSSSITEAAQNVSRLLNQAHPESPLPESDSEEDEFEAPVKFSLPLKGSSEPGPRFSYPKPHPSTSVEEIARLFPPPHQLFEREPKAHIPPRKRRRPIVTRWCLNCYNSKRKCDGKRPCQRCVQLGLVGLCVYKTDGLALTDDPTIDELTTREIIAELETPLPVQFATRKPLPRWADGDGDSSHPRAVILTSVYFWRCTSMELIS